MADLIERHGAVESVAAEWDRLALGVGTPPFLRPGWIAAWWEFFGSGRLEVLVSRREGKLTGVLPVARRAGGVFLLTNWHTPSAGAVAADDDARAALYAAAIAGGPRRFDASFLPAEAGDVGCLGEAAARYHLSTRVVQRSPYVPIRGEWDAYWGSLSKNLRGTVRRCRNRLADHGEVTVEVGEGGDGLDVLLEEGFRLEGSGWKGEAGTAIVARPETRGFYEAISRWAAEDGILRLAFLRVDGEAVAFTLSFESNGRHYLLKPGHDAARDSLGPGTVLTADMVERAFSLGLDSYEFLGAADRYKLRWADSCRELLRIQAFAPGPAGTVDRLAQTRGRRIAKKLLRRGG